MQCKCGSHAINHHRHGRDGSDPDLCDVCYWRKRVAVWQPIETALPPMDMPVWLYDGKRTFIGGRDAGDGDGWLWWRAVDHIERFNAEDWYIIDSENDDLHPTHWLPLPEPPKEEDHD